MSFVVTNQSVIRFKSHQKAEVEAGKLEDLQNTQRTLMFFNVDISSTEVGRCRQNEITATRTFDCNGKRRHPGGGLGHKALKANSTHKFYKYIQGSRRFESISGCRLREIRKRSSGGRRKITAYDENRRHFHYQSNKPRTYYQSSERASFQRPTFNYNESPEYQDFDPTAFPDINDYPMESQEQTEPTYQVALSASYCQQQEAVENYQVSEEYADHRSDYYPRDYYSTKGEPIKKLPTSENFYSYPEVSPQEDCGREYGSPLPRHSSHVHKQKRKHRRHASGSLPPGYPNKHDENYYYSTHHQEYNNNRNGYDNHYQPEDESKDRNSYEDPESVASSTGQDDSREDYEYYQRRHHQIAFPKSRHYRTYGNPSIPYMPFKERSEGWDSRMYHFPQKEYEGIPPPRYSSHVEYTRDRPRNHSRISKEIARLSTPEKYKYHSKIPRRKISKDDVFYPPARESVRKHRVPYKDRKETAKWGIPDPFRKSVPARAPRTHRPRIRDFGEIPHSRRYSGSESGQSNSFFDYLNLRESRIYQKSAPIQRKSVDFNKLIHLSDDDEDEDEFEIPHRIVEKSETPSTIFFTIELPNKKHRPPTPSHGKDQRPTRRDSGCENLAQKSVSDYEIKKEPSAFCCNAEKVYKSRRSPYDVKMTGSRKTMKLRAFPKKSKASLKKSSVSLAKSKMQPAFGSVLKPTYSVAISNHSLMMRNKMVSGKQERSLVPESVFFGKRGQRPPARDKGALPISTFKISDHSLTEPNKQEKPNLAENPLRRRGNRGSRYPTVYRGIFKEPVNEEVENYREYSMYNFMATSDRKSNKRETEKCENGSITWKNEYQRQQEDIPVITSSHVQERVSSGNCTEDSQSEISDKPSKINVCLKIRAEDVGHPGSPRIVSSKIVRCQESTHSIPDPQSPSNSALVKKASGSDHFESVRLSASGTKGCFPDTSIKLPSKRITLEACSVPPDNLSGGCSESSGFCQRRQIRRRPSYSLTRRNPFVHLSCCSFQCPRKPPKCGSNQNICPKSPPKYQCNLKRKSSMKGMNKCKRPMPKKRVCLNTRASVGCLSTRSHPSNTSQSCSIQSGGKKQSVTFSNCRCSRSHSCQFGGFRRLGICPGQAPKRCASAPLRIQPLCPASPERKCSRESQKNMQLACCPIKSSCDCGAAQSCAGAAESGLCCPNWEKDAKCRRCIVEELKRELLLSFQQDQQRLRMQQNGNMIIIPYCQSPSMVKANPSPFCSPDPVVYWAPCSNSQIPY